MKTKYILTLIIGFSLNFAKAQVGIYKNPYSNPPKITLAISDDDTGINWNSTNNISIVTDNTPKITINSSGNVGINETSPQYKLDVNANSDAVRISNLKAIAATDFKKFIVINNVTSEVGVKTNPSSMGQFIRLPFVDATYNAGNTTDFDFTANNDNAPNGAANVINTIEGSTINDANNTITLQEGVYSINLKVTGIFKGQNTSNSVSVHFLVNGNLYTFQPGVVYGNSGENADGFNNGEDTDSRKTGYLQEILVVPSSGATISFKLEVKSNNFRVYKSFVPTSSTGNSSRTVLTINRLR